MRVVVLGAAGQLGREVVRALVACGHTVRAALRRPPDPALPSSVEIRIADARNESEICASDHRVRYSVQRYRGRHPAA